MQRLIDPHGTWASPRPQDRPSFTGFLVWRDVAHQVSILYPREWSQEEGPPLRLRAPADAPHMATMTVEASRLPTTVEPDDLETLREGLERGIGSIRGAQVVRSDAESVGSLVDLEVEHTYLADEAEDGAPPVTWRRWLRVMYQRDVQYTLSAESLDGDAFEYWRPAFHSMMRMAIFADWTAEVTGRSWEPLDVQAVEIGPGETTDAEG